jgi:hypothetical protein
MSNSPKDTEIFGRDKNGRFAIGNNGKPKGAVNKTTKDLHQFITNFLNDKAFEIPLIWDTLDDKDKATLFIHLSKLVMPKNLNESIEQTEQPLFPTIINLGSGINPDLMTLEQARELVKRLENETISKVD